VLIAVPVPPGWVPAPGQTIAAYECSGELLTGTVCDDGTVLALFPADALRDAISARLNRIRETRRAAPSPRHSQALAPAGLAA
jgi:hypothetical protein